jgi:hypothetical protein
MTSGDAEHAVVALQRDGNADVLATGLRLADLRAVAPHLRASRPLLGYRREIGYWLLAGPSVGDVAARLRTQRSTPAGMGPDVA